jgi:hypothetical protein
METPTMTHKTIPLFAATSRRRAHTMEHPEDPIKKQKRTLETEKYEDQLKVIVIRNRDLNKIRQHLLHVNFIHGVYYILTCALYKILEI